MPRQAWSAKRERQYEHIKQGLEKQGRDEDTAEEIAARTVNKERARSGEARTSSPTSTRDISSGRRGGLRSHRGPGGRTKAQANYRKAENPKFRCGECKFMFPRLSIGGCRFVRGVIHNDDTCDEFKPRDATQS